MYFIVLYIRLFPNIGDKTCPFTVYMMQRIKTNAQVEIQKN